LQPADIGIFAATKEAPVSNNVDEAVDQVLSGGLAVASESEILRQLDAELQQQTQARALVLSGEAPQPWVLGGEGAGGFGSMAQRFISFYTTALHRELCDAEGGCLKDKYRQVLGGQDLQSQVKSLAPVVLAALGISASLVAPATVAAIVALWLARVGLEQWCAAPQEAPASPAPAAPAAAADTTPLPTDGDTIPAPGDADAATSPGA
jgi:hypothetical protein